MIDHGVRGAGWRRRPVLLDAAVVIIVLLGGAFLVPRSSGSQAPSVLEHALIALTLAAVPLRHRRPVTALALTVAGAAAVLLLGGIEAVAALGPLAALYTVALRTDRRTTVVAWASTAAVMTAAGVIGVLGASGAVEASRRVLLEEALPVLPWTAVVAAVGDGLRNRRAYLAAVEERAVRAEHSREEEARRRVAEERVRIARELHDVVAHHIAVVSVQAGVAQHLLSTRPGAAADALVTVRRSAAAVLEELGDILSVLREPGEPAARDAPAPGLARLDALVESFTAAGLAVEWSLRGQPRDLAPTVDLVAYRVLEEALTNALKHGTGVAHLGVEYGPSSVVLRVANPMPALVAAGHHREGAARTTGTGHGLLGMSERAAAVGGSLRAAPASAETFGVEAELPLRGGAPS